MPSPLAALPPRWRKALGDLRSSKSRTVLVVLSIAIGVFAVGAIASTQLMLSQDLGVAYAATNPAGAILFTDPFDDDLVRAVRHMDGVAEAEGTRTVRLRVKASAGAAGDAGAWRTLSLEARQDFANLRVDKIWPVRGAWPPPIGEMAIERNSLAFLHAGLGDTVEVETPDGRKRELRVSGVAYDMHQQPAAFSGFVYGYVTLDTLERLRLPRTFNQLSFTVAEQPLDKTHIQEVADRVAHRLEQGERTVTFTYMPTPGQHPAVEVISPLLLILGALGALALFLSAFLVVNTISALLAQQTAQIGVMKAIGARTGQLLTMYLGTVLVYGLLALVVAVPLGGIAAYRLTGYMASLVNFDLAGFRIPLLAFGLELLVGLLVPLLAAVGPILAGTRVTVREAISAQGAGGAAYGRSRLDRLVERLRALPRPLLLSLRNTFRRKTRLTLTLSTLTLAGAMFIGVTSVQRSLLVTLDDALDYWRYDVQANLAAPHRAAQIVDEALQVPGVIAAETWVGTGAPRQRPNGTQGTTLSVLGVPAETAMIQPVLLQGRWLLPSDDDAVVVNTGVTREEPDLQAGSEVVLKIDDQDTTWRVVGVVRGVMTGPIVYATTPALARLLHTQGQATSVQIVTSRHDAASQAAAAEALKAHFDDLRLQVSSTQTISDLRTGVEYQLNIIVSLMVIMAALMALVGGLGLMGTMSMNVLERAREIGVMRAIGASTGAVLQIFIVEGLLIGALSWLCGGLLSVPLSKLLSDGVGVSLLRAPLSYTFSAGGALLWLGIALALAALASLLPAMRAARMTVREVLAYE